MKAFVLLLVISVLSSAILILPTLAVEISGNSLTLSDDEAEVCRLGGGCVIITIKNLRAVAEEYSRKWGGSCGDKT